MDGGKGAGSEKASLLGASTGGHVAQGPAPRPDDRAILQAARNYKYWGPPVDAEQLVALRKVEQRDHAAKRSQLNVQFLRRLGRIWRISFNGACSRNLALFFFTGFVGIISMFLSLLLFLMMSQITGALESGNVNAYIQVALIVIAGMSLGAVGSATTTSLAQLLTLRLRRNLTRHIHYRYMRKKTYYMLNNMDKRIDNPDQRISEDAANFSTTITTLFIGPGGIITILFLLTYETIQCLNLMGLYPTLSIFGFFFVAIVLVRFFTNRLVPILFRQDRLEGDFRFAHVHLRDNAESVAFYGGQDQQHAYLNGVLRTVLRNFYKATKFTAPLNWVVQLLASASNMTAFLVPPILTLTNTMPVVPGETPDQLYLAIYGMLSALCVSGISGILQQAPAIANLAGYTNRIGEFLEVLDDLDAQQEESIYQLAASDQFVVIDSYQQADFVAMQNVTCRTPDNLLLVENLSFKIERGGSLLVIGPSGVGKSSILRVVAGLWPSGQGVVYRMGAVGRDGMFFLPQRPYLVLGNLKQQILYPSRASESTLTDVELRELLRSVNLEHLLNDFDPDNTAWETKLSGGEQQRLAMARLFYHRPAFAILDECTSACDPETERRFYARCKDLNIAYMSVSHNTNVRSFHENTLVLLGQGRWKLIKTADLPDAHAIPSEEWFLTNTTEFDGQTIVTKTGTLNANAEEEERVEELMEMGIGKVPKGSLYRPISEETMVLQEPLQATKAAVHKFRNQDVPEGALESFWTTRTRQELKADNLSMIKRANIPQKAKLDCLFVTRFIRLLKIGFPGKSRSLFWLVLGLFCCVYSTCSIVAGPYITAMVSNAASANNIPGFRIALLFCLAQLICDPSFISLRLFSASMTLTHMRRNMMRYLHYRYLSGRAFYDLLCISSTVDNPDQRLADDVRLFSTSFVTILFSTQMCIVVAMLSIIGLTSTQYAHLTWRGVAMAYGLAIIGYMINRWLMGRVAPYNFQQDRTEGDFRFAHIRFRNNCESVAFFKGADEEHKLMSGKFAALLANQLALIVKTWPLNLWIAFYSNLNVSSGVILPALVYFTVGFGDTPILTGLMLYATAYVNVTGQMSALAAAGPEIANLAGHVNRLGDMLETMDRLEEAERARAGSYTVSDSASTIAVDFDVVNPLNITLIRDVKFQLGRKENILLVGPSGCGKSSILRTLCGLWQPGGQHASIVRPMRVGRDGILFLPQKAYLTLGSLRQQIVYPLKEADASLSDAEMDEILDCLKIRHLNSQVYAAANSDEQSRQTQWEDMLSGGERQRLGMARLLYHRPAFAILDESTSAVSEDVEEAFYKKLIELNIGFISIGHRPSLYKLHTRILRVENGRLITMA